MKFLYVFFIYMFLLAELHGQGKELSLSVSSYNVSGTYFPDYYDDGNEFSLNAKLFNSSYGYYYPFFSPNENLSFGINAVAQTGICFASTNLNTEGNILYDFGLPITGTLRLGAGSGKYSTAPIGIGISFGGRIHSLLVDGDIFMTNKNAPFQSFIRPYGFVEIVFDFQKRNRSFFDNTKIQFAFQPILNQTIYNSTFDDYQSNSLKYFSVSAIKFFPFK